MKKAAINTFSDGLAKDMNELTTPNLVLTNCLNGTLITYNGNEFSLLNDMGNALIGTSYLSPGYVPVGMKEYGGIIYVASYNPKTKRGLIGSFPSPLQLYGDGDTSMNTYTFDISLFIEMTSITTNTNTEINCPFIKTEFKREKIFKTKKEDIITYKKFHPGDKFIIKSGIISTEIINAIKNGVLSFKLAAVSNSGSLEYLDDSNLKLYNYSDTDRKDSSDLLWIYLDTENKDIANLLSESPDKILIYNAKTSGLLMIIAEFNFFDTFNLYRSYSLVEDTYTAKFWAKAKGNLDSTYILGKYNNNNAKDTDNNLIETWTDIIDTTSNYLEINSYKKDTDYEDASYTIYPAAVSSDNKLYGILERLGKSGVLNFNNLRSNNNSLGSWNYYVNTNSVTISWSYDYFDIDDTKTISKLVFNFIPLDKIDDINSEISLDKGASLKEKIALYSGGIKYNIFKESYNGDFEDIFPLNSGDGLLSKYIYVCRIDKYYNDNGEEGKEVIAYKYLYTGTYFNTNTIGTTREEISIPINISYTNAKKVSNTTYYKNTGWNSTTETMEAFTNIPTITDYTIVKPENSSDYSFLTTKSQTYDINVLVNNEFDITNNSEYLSTDFAGSPDTDILDNLVTDLSVASNVGTATYSSTDANLISRLPNSYITTPNKEEDTIQTIQTNKEWKILPTLSRSILADADSITSKSINTERLYPIFDSTNTSEKSKLFSFVESGNTLMCVGGKRDGNGEIYYNTTITGSSGTRGSSKGTAVDNGYGDAAILMALSSMGNGTVGIFAGVDGDKASLRFCTFWLVNVTNGELEFYSYSDGPYRWYSKDYEIDKEDNFLLLTWKQEDGKHIFVNMGSRKNEPTQSKPRKNLNVMIKAILSLLLIAKNVTVTTNYTGPNKTNYIYNTQFDSNIVMTPTIQNNNSPLAFYLDSKTTNSKSIEELLSTWDSLGLSGLTNYLPKFKYVAYGNNNSIDLGSDINIEDAGLLNCYLTAYSNPDTSSLAGNYAVQINQMNNDKVSYSYNTGSLDSLDESFLRKYIFRGKVTNIDTSGICTLETNSEDGSPKVIGIAGNDTDTTTPIQYWATDADTTYTTGRTIQICNINKMFKSKIRASGLESSRIESGYYNELLANKITDDDEIHGKWVKGRDKETTSMNYHIHFGVNSNGLSLINRN